MTSDSDQQYLLEMAQFSVLGDPTEYDAYGVITEAFILHKTPRNRYTIFPQLFLPWKPDEPLDTRGSLPDFGLGRYYSIAPHIRLQGGCEVKKATWLMEDLPPTNIISEESDVQNLVKLGILQAEDQAKSAVKGNLLPNDQKLLWLLFVGPYFTVHEFGPFAAQQLVTRSHRPNESGDFAELTRIRLEAQRPLPNLKMYLLGTPEAARQLENFIKTTAAFLP